VNQVTFARNPLPFPPKPPAPSRKPLPAVNDLARYVYWRSPRCPECGKNTLVVYGNAGGASRYCKCRECQARCIAIDENDADEDFQK